MDDANEHEPDVIHESDIYYRRFVVMFLSTLHNAMPAGTIEKSTTGGCACRQRNIPPQQHNSVAVFESFFSVGCSYLEHVPTAPTGDGSYIFEIIKFAPETTSSNARTRGTMTRPHASFSAVPRLIYLSR